MAEEEKSGQPKKPRLVIATDNFLPRWDGIARFLAEMIPRLLQEYDITVVSPDYGQSHLDGKVTRVLIPLSGKRYGDYMPAQWKPEVVSAAVSQADVVFTQTIGPIGLLANRHARRQGKPLAAFIHSIEWELVPRALDVPALKRIAYPATKLLTRRLYNRCSLLIVPSENIADMLAWQHITARKRVVHLGVDTRRFVAGNRAAAKERLGLPKESLVVGFHGRLGHEKNLLTLSRAFTRLRAKEKRLLVIGTGVEELRRRLSRVPGCILPGTTDDIVKYLQAMDIYVMPSFTETTSLAVLEAMSCELPVISSPVGFIQQYIHDGENGMFFATKSWFDLARRLQLLADNPQLRERLGAAARRTVKEQFDWDRTAEGIAEALRGLLKKEGS
jgi:glycosyltransferase involved in cell wall biosynthesis